MALRALFVFSVAAAAVGYRAAANGPLRFFFSEATLSTAPTLPPGSRSTRATYVTFRWADKRTSTTVAAAKRFDCFPTGMGAFPVPAVRSFALLASPIGGAKYPKQNGELSDDFRFFHPPGANALKAVGPVLMQFRDYSGGARPSILATGASIWTYDFATQEGQEPFASRFRPALSCRARRCRRSPGR
jgi:hypothetical protein